ncbi:MAG: nucleotide sugar dehydrogenase [Opitutaceae bacterium]|jgi:nucleotide sugar dehydrogenase
MAYSFPNNALPLVCVQGIGFVGSAMAIAIASAAEPDGAPRFNVVAIDLDTSAGRERATCLNSGRLLFSNIDQKLANAHATALKRGNLHASTDTSHYAKASIVVVDVNLDVDLKATPPAVDLSSLRRAIGTLGDLVPEGCLILVETTVPPGTCEKVVGPLLMERLAIRGMNRDSVLLAHSYERVMPGAAYLDSIINFWRVYSGHTEAAAIACGRFLSQIIDTKRFPLTRVKTTTASELGKVLENSYRATTIAFVEEWSRLAERMGVDIFPVIDAIRMRPTHANFRQPGFGVGGYCLTKDPLLGGVAARQLFGASDLKFPFSELAVAINKKMPLESLRLVREALGGSIAGKRILLLGVSYREDVGDTRYAPSEIFVRAARNEGAQVVCFDPLVNYWNELEERLPESLPGPVGFDAVVFVSTHSLFTTLDIPAWLSGARPLLLDGNRVLSARQINGIEALNLPFRSIGRGTKI